jgi:hypothetical protein
MNACHDPVTQHFDSFVIPRTANLFPCSLMREIVEHRVQRMTARDQNVAVHPPRRVRRRRGNSRSAAGPSVRLRQSVPEVTQSRGWGAAAPSHPARVSPLHRALRLGTAMLVPPKSSGGWTYKCGGRAGERMHHRESRLGIASRSRQASTIHIVSDHS